MPTLGSFQWSNVLSPASLASFLRFCSGRSAVVSGAGDIARLRVRSRRAVFRFSPAKTNRQTVGGRKYCDEQDMIVLSRRFMVYYENTLALVDDEGGTGNIMVRVAAPSW